MKRNLKSADVIVKLTTAFVILILYAFKVINGPFALFLSVLAISTLLFYAIKVWIGRYFLD